MNRSTGSSVSNKKRLRTLAFAIPGLFLVPALLAGCPTRPIKKVEPERVGETYDLYPQVRNRDVDILFVVDNSGSMREEQTKLTAKFRDLIDRLSTLDGGLPNVHIGVVSSDVGTGRFPNGPCNGSGGDHGVLQNRASACTPPSGRYIQDIDNGAGGRTRNYPSTTTLADTFACIAKLGTSGCGLEQHLESMKLALDGSNVENAGFLRENALLAIVIVADEDDCSAKPPGDVYDTDPALESLQSTLGPLNSFRCFEFGITCNPQLARTTGGPRLNCVSNENSPYMKDVKGYVDFLTNLKRGKKDKIIVAGIIGNPSPVEVNVTSTVAELAPSCETTDGKAAPGIRLATFINAFGNNGTTLSICQSDYSPAMQRIGDLIINRLKGNCATSRLLDVGSDPQGVQVEGGTKRVVCSVTDIVDRGTDQAVETPLPACGSAAASPGEPCWKPVINAMDCAASPEQIEIKVERAGNPNTNLETLFRCATQE